MNAPAETRRKRRRLGRALRGVAGWAAALLLLLWRSSCRYRVVNDPRPALREAGRPYVYALLHAHQIAALFVNDERSGRLAAMVSRSADGDVLVPSLTVRGVRAVRGSSRRGEVDKGGAAALDGLRELLEQRVAALLAVDGPRGPRNGVKPGVAKLVREVEGAVVLPTLVLPNRRHVFEKAWDRIQAPLPFSRVDLIFGGVIEPLAGESAESLRERIERDLCELEARWDPDEAKFAGV